MKIVNKKLDYSADWESPDIYMFTGNSTVKKNSALVMGRGAALQVRDTFPGIDKICGNRIKCMSDSMYGVLFFRVDPLEPAEQKLIGVFQVKTNYSSDADLNIIENSTEVLKRYAENFPNKTFHMNFPGIGAGHLNYGDVFKIVHKLPNNIILYK